MKTITDARGVACEIDADAFLVDGTIITVDLDEIIECGGLEGFLNLISERAGFPLLMQQEYAVLRGTETELTLLVKGDVSMELECRGEK